MPPRPKSPQKLKLSVGVTALRYVPAASSAAARVVLAHGAGAGQTHPFMIACAAGLRDRGVEVATFDFPYVVRGSKAPDRAAVLEACARAAVMETGERGRPVVLGGKSMGGRIASQIVAAGGDAVANVRGLFFLGYPLHPPGKPADLRVEHWPRVKVPCLFMQGTRDPFGSPAELAPHLRALGTPASRRRVLAIPGGDHSLGVGKRASPSAAEVMASVFDAIAAFVRAQAAPPKRVSSK